MIFHYRIQGSCKKGTLAEIADVLNSKLEAQSDLELEIWKPQWPQWRSWYKYPPLASRIPEASIPSKYFYSGPSGSFFTSIEEIKAHILRTPQQTHMIWKPTWPKWISWHMEPRLAADLEELVPLTPTVVPTLKASINDLLSQKKLLNDDTLEHIHKHIESQIHQRIASSKIERTALFFWKTILYSTLQRLSSKDHDLLNMSSTRFNLPKFCSFFEHNQRLKIRISPSLQLQLASESPIQYCGERHILRNCKIWKKTTQSSSKTKLSVRRRFALLFHQKTEYPLVLCVLLLQSYEHYLISTLAQEETVHLQQLGSIDIQHSNKHKYLYWNNSDELIQLLAHQSIS